MLEIGSLVDKKYKVLDKIGQGGMSIVYLVINERANKTWAIKEVRKDVTGDFSAIRQGLIAETNILKKLNHKYLPSIVDVIDDGECFLIVMDYIQGKSLKEILMESLRDEGRPIGIREAISLGIQLCDVLYYLHTRPEPIIYRDMKPSNVMLKPDGEISLIDFGTARVFKRESTEDTVCLGTPGYAAPEQHSGRIQTSAQTDIYSLGATLHHLVTGRNPVDAPFSFPPITECRPTLMDETPREYRNMLLGLEMIISKCTQYEMKHRYRTCKEVMYDLEHSALLALPYKKQLKRKMAAFSISAGLSVILFAGAIFGSVMEKLTEKNGYDYYIEAAMLVAQEEKINFYKKAIVLNPVRSEAYLSLLDTLTSDNLFSEEDDALLIELLNSRYAHRSQDNKSYFQQNKSGFLEFSYQLGLAYYYLAGAGSDKSSAAGWFNHVIEAKMDMIDFGSNNEQKYRWQARANILGRISHYYRNKLGVINQMGDAHVSYLDYWKDLVALMDEHIIEKDNVITELRLYNEIVYQIYSRTVEFKQEAGLTSADLEGVLKEISDRLIKIEGSENKLVSQLVNDISENINRAEKVIQATY